MEFRLPELGEGVAEGELVKWRVKVGDTVKDDQPLCEVMTDKATIEIPSHFSGTVVELVAKEGDIVKVNQLMLKGEAAGGSSQAVSKPAEAPKAAAPAPATAPAQKPAGATAAAAPVPAMNARPSADVLASPSTRKLAREIGVDLGVVPATGPHGRVLREDVERVSKGGAPMAARGPARPYNGGPAAPDERTPIRGMRKKISEKMRQSKDKAAHFTYVEEADATELVRLRTQAKAIAEARGIKLTYLPFILKAMVAACRKHPKVNSIYDEATNELVTRHYFNIAISVQTEDGLTVPVVKNVEQKTIFEIAQNIADLVDRARHKRLTMDDLTGSSITLTNAGSIGGLFATPIINYPEVAILGFNKIARKPVVVTRNGAETIEIRDWTYFSISMNHQLLDGADAAEFLKTFITYIENPATLFLEDL
ncbi:MAG: 2-oxo acid dehydrogenase subunit E2 [Bdellovibrionales bacterium]|nr:2-oxo acid dehydrogenase subunit E2 [Bdellovibrionales bacterium]